MLYTVRMIIYIHVTSISLQVLYPVNIRRSRNPTPQLF